MKINQKEIEQMAKMFEWSDTLKGLLCFDLRFFKPSEESKDKTPYFKLESIEWTPDDKWSSVMGCGPTVLDAMKHYSTKRAERNAKYAKRGILLD